MGKLELWAIRAIVVVVLVAIIGIMVGGVIYGPRLKRALLAAETANAGAVVSDTQAGLEAATAASQAKTQAAEVAITLNMKESSREILASPDAGAVVSPDLYGAFADGLQRNRPPGGDRATSPDARSRTVAPD